MIDLLSETRICDDCGRELPLNSDNFHVDSSRKDGLRDKCKDCTNRHKREYQLQHKSEWLIRNDFFPGYQVLCFNHNSGKDLV